MVAFIGLLGIAQVISGVVIYFIGRSAAHEVLAAVTFGTGVIAFALAVLIERLDKHHERTEQIARRL